MRGTPRELALLAEEMANRHEHFKLTGLIEYHGRKVCGCYPECRNDCPDWHRCYESMPEYWDAQYRAKKYAEGVRARKPDTWGAQYARQFYLTAPVAQERYTKSQYRWWDARGRVWRRAYSMEICK